MRVYIPLLSIYATLLATLTPFEPVSSLSQSLKRTTFIIPQRHTVSQTTTRRNLLEHGFITTLSSTTFFTLVSSSSAQNANALVEQCRPRARNCIRTTWTAQTSLSREQAVIDIRNVLNSYPQNGQNGVDCNGWSIVNDSLSSPSSSNNLVRLEYRSCIGPAALAINLAQPFIDDVILEFDDTNKTGEVTLQVRSSSRMGSSDLFVNKKRIEYLGDKLRQKGWFVPDVKYGT